jgi:glycosyltransferase involved in cell wall biosynthesis
MARPLLTIVLILDHASVTGGQAKVALESALGLKRAGHRPILFTAVKPIDPRLLAENIDVICLDQQDLLGHDSKIAAAAQGIWNVTASRKLGALLASLPKDSTLIHVHGWAKALSASIATPIRKSGLPAIYTMHDYFLFCPNGGFYNYRQQQICTLTPLSRTCWATHCDSRGYPDKVWRATRTAVMKKTAKLPELFSDIILFSPFQDKIVRPYLPQKAKTHFVSNPIDAEDWGPKPNPASGDFLFVGRLSEEKGVFCFAEAARKAKIKPVFIGDGPLAAAIKQAYPEADVRGWKSPPEIKQALRAARALVFPSLWYEGQPLTVLEAQALGTPVIVSDGCAGREDVEDGISGLWFANNDTNALAAALHRLQDDDVVAQMSEAAYRRFWANAPTLDRHVGRLLEVYEKMIEKSGR